jgi:hypothetical protein
MFLEWNGSLFDEFVCRLGLFWHEWTILKREWNESFKAPRVPKGAQFTYERVEYVFLFDEPLKGSKTLKSLKLAWRFVLTGCDIYHNPFT